MKYAWLKCTGPDAVQVGSRCLGDQCILFWFSFGKENMIRGKEEWGKNSPKKERIKFLYSLHTLRKPFCKACIRSGSGYRHRTFGVCSWLLPLPLTLSKSADFSACKIIFPLTLILTSWGYLEDNVSNNVLRLHHSFHRELIAFYIHWEWSLWEMNRKYSFLEMNLGIKSLNLIHCRKTYGT